MYIKASQKSAMRRKQNKKFLALSGYAEVDQTTLSQKAYPKEANKRRRLAQNVKNTVLRMIKCAFHKEKLNAIDTFYHSFNTTV